MYQTEYIRIIRQYMRIMYQRIAAWHFRNGCESLEVGWRKHKKGNEREENTKKMLKMFKDVEIVHIQFKMFKVPFFMRTTPQCESGSGAMCPGGRTWLGRACARLSRCWGAAGARALRRPAPTHSTNLLFPPSSFILAGTKPGSTVQLGICVGRWVTLHQAKLILRTSPSEGDVSSSTSQNTLLLSRVRWRCPPNHFHGNMQNAIYIMTACSTHIVLVGHTGDMKIKK